jgi:hypothetical protein
MRSHMLADRRVSTHYCAELVHDLILRHHKISAQSRLLRA